METDVTKFSKMELRDGQLVETEVRYISQQQLAACPHCIFTAEHYRQDGTCKCDDPNEKVMRDWGYTWSKRDGRWR